MRLLLIMLLATLSSAPAWADADPTRAIVQAQIVDADGEPIELLRKDDWIGPCQKVSDWRSFSTDNRLSGIMGPYNETWCYADVYIMAGGSTSTFHIDYQGVDKRRISAFSQTGDRAVSSAEATMIAGMINGKVRFKVYPDVGMVELRTFLIKGEVYTAQIDSSTLTPGQMNELGPIVMATMPKIQVITELTGDPGDMLIEFMEDLPASSLPMRRTDGSQSLAGTWVVAPGEYPIHEEMIPDGVIVMIDHNGKVTRLDVNEPLVVDLDDRIVISIGNTVE